MFTSVPRKKKSAFPLGRIPLARFYELGHQGSGDRKLGLGVQTGRKCEEVLPSAHTKASLSISFISATSLHEYS